MTRNIFTGRLAWAALVAVVGGWLVVAVASAQVLTSPEALAQAIARMSADKPRVMQQHRELLAQRYDLADRPVPGVTMARGKPVQGGVRVKLPPGMTWDRLANMTPQQVRDGGHWPAGFLPLPHPNHPEGGMLFPSHHIEEVRRQ